MNALGLSLFEYPNGPHMLDLSARARGISFSTDGHGFADFSCLLPMSLQNAIYHYNRAGLPHVVASAGGHVAWEGRLEDVDIIPGGLRLSAFGYQRAMSDVPYLALWSASRVDAWRPAIATDIAGRDPSRYTMDFNGRLFIGLLKNAVYSGIAPVGSVAYLSPNNDATDINYVTFTYNYTLPTNWGFQVRGFDGNWASGVASIITTVGGTGSGTFTWDLSATPRQIIALEIFNNTGGPYTYIGETGANNIIVTDVRLNAGGANVYADEIVGHMLDYVRLSNPTQLNASKALIESPILDLHNEVYEDIPINQISDRLARLGDNQTPPRLWEWGVWENRLLHFRPRGSQARTWYVDDAPDVVLGRTIRDLRNHGYGVWQGPDGYKRRYSADYVDSNSISRWAIRRVMAVEQNTTNATQALATSEAAVRDSSDPEQHSGITIRRIYDGQGIQWPAWAVRAGDTIVQRGLPFGVSTSIDRARSFRCARTNYDVDRNLLNIEPEKAIPTLATMLARREAGV